MLYLSSAALRTAMRSLYSFWTLALNLKMLKNIAKFWAVLYISFRLVIINAECCVISPRMQKGSEVWIDQVLNRVVHEEILAISAQFIHTSELMDDSIKTTIDRRRYKVLAALGWNFQRTSAEDGVEQSWPSTVAVMNEAIASNAVYILESRKSLATLMK